jgi:Ser/Thr protein kinase RdoA (MazF antagonist)
MQCEAITHIGNKESEAKTSGVVESVFGRKFEIIKDSDGEDRIVWVLEYLPKTTYVNFNPKSLHLIREIGAQTAYLDVALEDFEHERLTRELPWDLAKADWIEGKISAIESQARQAMIRSILFEYQSLSCQLSTLPRVPVHNDVNDHNILVNGELTGRPSVTGIIDFGDMCSTPRVCGLAVAGAYMVLDQADPVSALESLVEG